MNTTPKQNKVETKRIDNVDELKKGKTRGVSEPLGLDQALVMSRREVEFPIRTSSL